jgi:hypothetical protein
MYENNYKTLNLITTTLGRNVYDRVSHLETAHEIWLELCNTYDGSSKITSPRKDTYNSHSFPNGGSHTHFKPRHLDDPHFFHHGSRHTQSNGEV